MAILNFKYIRTKFIIFVSLVTFKTPTCLIGEKEKKVGWRIKDFILIFKNN